MDEKEIQIINLSEEAVDYILGWLSNHATFVACEPTYEPHAYHLISGEYQDADYDEDSISQLTDLDDMPCRWLIDYNGFMAYSGEINCSPEEEILGGIESRRNFILEVFKTVNDLPMLQTLIESVNNGK